MKAGRKDDLNNRNGGDERRRTKGEAFREKLLDDWFGFQMKGRNVHTGVGVVCNKPASQVVTPIHPLTFCCCVLFGNGEAVVPCNHSQPPYMLHTHKQ